MLLHSQRKTSDNLVQKNGDQVNPRCIFVVLNETHREF